MSELLNKLIPELPAINPADINDNTWIIVDDGEVTWKMTYGQLRDKLQVEIADYINNL